MLSARNDNRAFLDCKLTCLGVNFATNFAFISRQFQKFCGAIIFCGAMKHEVVIKTENVVSDYNVGVFALNQFRPFQQHVALATANLDF